MAAIPDEEPTVERVSGPGRDGSTVTRHPAFGQIGASRVSGGRILYGSDFIHRHYVTVTIRRSTLTRDINHDWPHGHDELIEVALSEAQWATFVSTLNSGLGVQCTIEAINNRQVPGIPRPLTRADQFTEEVSGSLAKLVSRIESAEAAVKDLAISSKARTVIENQLFHIKQDIQANLPYVAKCFGEHIEATTEKAKIEVNAYVENRIHRAGLDALTAGESAPLELPESKEPHE